MKTDFELLELQEELRDLSKDKLITRLKNNFRTEEIIDPATFKRWGEVSWMFIDARLIANIIFFRESINKPFNANNWHLGGIYDERGLRPNISEIVKGRTNKNSLYLSPHTMGKALDWKIKGMSSAEARIWAKEKGKFFPYKFRLENTLNGDQISWIHLDVFDYPANAYCTLLNI